MSISSFAKAKPLTFEDKLLNLNWGLVFLIFVVASIGFAMLYSAAGQSWDPWASRQMVRFGLGLVVMFVAAMFHIQFWMKMAWPFYFFCLGLLVWVEIFGHTGMGATRWIDLKFMVLQPSELVKISVILLLARYYHLTATEDLSSFSKLVGAALIFITPMALVLRQPDLGTALMIAMVAITIMFVAGVRLWLFITGGILALISVPVAWQFLHDYQKKRVLTFLNPESDPLGAGYHIMQSKIAFGSGGIDGKGFGSGSQAHLNFLPEKQTDFIFTMFAEEFGLVGGIGLVIIFAMIFTYGFFIAWRARNHFGQLLAIGLICNFFLYVFINIAMVMGLLPVVGVPLPLISYGGTVMLTVMFGFGLLLSVSVHRDVRISKRAMRVT